MVTLLLSSVEYKFFFRNKPYIYGIYVWLCLCLGNGMNAMCMWLMAILSHFEMYCLQIDAPEGTVLKFLTVVTLSLSFSIFLSLTLSLIINLSSSNLGAEHLSPIWTCQRWVQHYQLYQWATDRQETVAWESIYTKVGQIFTQKMHRLGETVEQKNL